MVLSAAYTHFTASSNAFRHPTAHIAGEVENTFSASIAELVKREYSGVVGEIGEVEDGGGSFQLFSLYSLIYCIRLLGVSYVYIAPVVSWTNSVTFELSEILHRS